ncbi:MAG: SCP2 sterol-binding domain-containing protein [Egibacteraceae bacterium]
MALYGSQEWLEQYMATINTSEPYRKAAATWEGELALVIEADPARSWPETRAAVLDLWHGECRAVRVADEREADTVPFCIRGVYSRWRDVMRKELDPVTAIMQGKLRLRGDMGVWMRYVTASKELVNAASDVPTEFPDD